MAGPGARLAPYSQRYFHRSIADLTLTEPEDNRDNTPCLFRDCDATFSTSWFCV